MWTGTAPRKGTSEYFAAPVPLTYLNMFPAEGGFGTTTKAASAFTFEGDYYLVAHYDDLSGNTTRDAGAYQSVSLRYRLAADAYGDAEPGPVFADEPVQDTTTEDSSAGISPVVIGAIVALILSFAAFSSWLVLKGRKK